MTFGKGAHLKPNDQCHLNELNDILEKYEISLKGYLCTEYLKSYTRNWSQWYPIEYDPGDCGRFLLFSI